MKKWYWVVLIILTYVVFLVAYTPASYITSYIQNKSQNNVSFNGVTGTLFAGQASSATYQGILVNNLKWQLSPWSLLLLRGNVDVTGGNIRKAEQVYVQGNLSISLLDIETFSLKNAKVLVPTKTVLSQIKLPVFVSASGRFRMDIEQFDFENGCQQLQGKGNWLNAAVEVNNKKVDFGTFEAALSCNPPAFAMQISPTNELKLDAKASIDLAGKFSVEGEFSVPSSMPNEIKQAAPFFGKEKRPGVYDIRF